MLAQQREMFGLRRDNEELQRKVKMLQDRENQLLAALVSALLARHMPRNPNRRVVALTRPVLFSRARSMRHRDNRRWGCASAGWRVCVGKRAVERCCCTNRSAYFSAT